MNILLTGSCGYIGSSLLSSNPPLDWDIDCFDNLMYDQGPLVVGHQQYYNFFRENVLGWSDNLKRSLASADVIIPLHALVGAPLCDQHPETAKATNYEWYKTLLKHISKHQLVVFPNTNSSYGSYPGICTEETPINPISLYAKTKQQTEDLLLQEHENTIVFRLATVFGASPRMRLDLLINNLTLEGYRTGKIKVFDGHYRRNYVHVMDVVRAIQFAIDSSSKMIGSVFNLGNDSINMSKLELAQNIAKFVNCEVELDTSGRTDGDKRDYNVSSAKLYSLGYKPLADLEYGVKQLLRYYQFLPLREYGSMRNY